MSKYKLSKPNGIINPETNQEKTNRRRELIISAMQILLVLFFLIAFLSAFTIPIFIEIDKTSDTVYLDCVEKRFEDYQYHVYVKMDEEIYDNVVLLKDYNNMKIGTKLSCKIIESKSTNKNQQTS